MLPQVRFRAAGLVALQRSAAHRACAPGGGSLPEEVGARFVIVIAQSMGRIGQDILRESWPHAGLTNVAGGSTGAYAGAW